MSTETIVQERVITVVATKGGRIEKITTDAVTWGDLREIIQDKWDLGKLKAVENVNKTTLEHIDAVLPTGDFRLFLRPSQTKSGTDFSNMGFSEMRNSYIKIDEEAKKFLSSFKSDKNWTQLTTPELREGLTAYEATKSGDSTSNITPAKEEVVTDAGERVLVNALGNLKSAQTLLENAWNEIQNNEEISEDEFDELDSRFENIQDEVSAIENILEDYYDADGTVTEKAEAVETEEEKAAREEQEDIEREMREIEDGF